MSPDLEALAEQARELLQHVFEVKAHVTHLPLSLQVVLAHGLKVNVTQVADWWAWGVGHDDHIHIEQVDRLRNATAGLDWPRRMRQGLSHALVRVMGWPPPCPCRPDDPHLTFPQAQVLLAAYGRLWALAEAEAES